MRGRTIWVLVSATFLGGLALGVVLTQVSAPDADGSVAQVVDSTSKATSAPASTAATDDAAAPPSVEVATPSSVEARTPTSELATDREAAGSFVETFDGDTGLDRFDTGVFHRSDGTGAAWPGAATWSGDHDLSCGSPDTQRTIRRSDKSESFYVCRDHLMTAIGDTDGYSTGWFSPKQTFSNATQVSWDANITDMLGRQWWEVSIVPATFESGVVTCPHCSVIDWLADTAHLPAYPPDSVVIGIGPHVLVATDGVDRNVAYAESRCNFDPEGCASKAIRRPFSVTDNRDGTIAVDYGGVRTFTVPGSFPAGEFRVVFKDHNYTPDKDGLPVGYTWHWDSIAVV